MWLPLLALLVGLPATAQEVASAETRSAQYVLVLDDSRSMETADGDRLAVFAARSLLSMLDDRDEVTVVRLNGPREEEPPPPIRPLETHQEVLSRTLALDGITARYGADYTPCRSALQQVRQQLEERWTPGVAQTVLFLTDGRCTPRDDREDQVEPIFEGLPAAEHDLFHFYVLRFRGEEISPGLTRLAERYRGEVLEVSGDEPTAILYPFSQALSRAQGYESHLLDPGNVRLPSHRGAKRVRLLAVAPGNGPDLSFDIRARRQGDAPRDRGETITGTHRYGADGRTFRFAAIDYEPEDEPMEVRVTGAEEWKVVALPEYRLAARLNLYAGGCDALGAPVRYAVDTGTSLCVVAEMVDDEGQPVGRGLSSSLRPTIRLRRADQESVTELAPSALPGGTARYALARPNLAAGDYELQAVFRLSLGDSRELNLASPRESLAVSSVSVEPQPARFDLGSLRPGQRVSRPFTLDGTFPAATATATFADRGSLPSCLTAELNGEPEGASQSVRAQQKMRLTITVHPYCGPTPIDRSVETALRLQLEATRTDTALPLVEIPLSFDLTYDLGIPPELELTVDGGDEARMELPLAGPFEDDLGGLTFGVLLERPDEAADWPDDATHLRVSADVGADGGGGEEKDGVLLATAHPGSGDHAGTASIPLTVTAHRCCPGGTFRTQLGLLAASDQVSPPGAPALEPLLVPLRIHVRPAGVWACYGPALLTILGLILLAVLIWCGYNIWRQSHFLDAERLAGRLTPLVWTGYNDTREQPARDEVLRLVRRGMGRPQRLQAWLRSNPLRLALPGRRYEETVRLDLEPDRDVNNSQIVVETRRRLPEALRKNPQDYRGQLYAVAHGGLTFYAVPDEKGRILRMRPIDNFSPNPTEEGPTRLRGDRLVRSFDRSSPPEDGAAAGWAVG
jgi:Mg-chelatase subunit ChlD